MLAPEIVEERKTPERAFSRGDGIGDGISDFLVFGAGSEWKGPGCRGEVMLAAMVTALCARSPGRCVAVMSSGASTVSGDDAGRLRGHVARSVMPLPAQLGHAMFLQRPNDWAAVSDATAELVASSK